MANVVQSVQDLQRIVDDVIATMHQNQELSQETATGAISLNERAQQLEEWVEEQTTASA
ncbi:MAG: hypothetical protein AAGF58_14705 [Pseudomonadota bacterium]